jgi:hypothetical protein
MRKKMSIKIVSEISKQYLLKEDAIEGFKIAVENCQTRLALQVLVDIIDGMMEIFDYAMEEVAEDDRDEPYVPAVVRGHRNDARPGSSQSVA